MADYKKPIVQYLGQLTQILDADVCVVNGGIDTSGATPLVIGGTNASAIDIGQVGVTTTIKGDLGVDGDEIVVGTSKFTGTSTFEGDVQIGDPASGGDRLAIASTIEGGDLAGSNTAILPTDDAGGLREVVFGSTAKRLAEVHSEEFYARSATATDFTLFSPTGLSYSRASGGGTLFLSAATAPTSGGGHGIAVNAGAAFATGNGNGGSVQVNGGAADGTGTGGGISLTAGSGGATGVGGAISIDAGLGQGVGGVGGAAFLRGGTSTADRGGHAYVRAGSGTGGTDNGTVYLGDLNSLAVEIGSATTPTSVNGALTVDGNTTLGNAITDKVTFNAQAASHLIPDTDITYDLGENTTPLRWRNVYAQNFVGGITPSGSLIPSVDNTYDLGSLGYRWKTLYLGPASLNVYQDPAAGGAPGPASESYKTTLGYPGGGSDAELLFTNVAGVQKLSVKCGDTTTVGNAGNRLDVVAGKGGPGSGGSSGGKGGILSLSSGDGGTDGGLGGGGAGDGGLQGGTGGAGGDGGTIYVRAGTGGVAPTGSPGGQAGILNLSGGTGGAGGAGAGESPGLGGDINIFAGAAGAFGGVGSNLGGSVYVRAGAGSGGGADGTIYIGDVDTKEIHLGAGGVTTPVIFDGYVKSDILPETGNTYDIGSSTLPWAEGHFGDASVYIHADLTGAEYIKITDVGGYGAIELTASGGAKTLAVGSASSATTGGHFLVLYGGDTTLANATGGQATLKGGRSYTGNGNGGQVDVTGGRGVGSGLGGQVNLIGGMSIGVGGVGGDVVIRGGLGSATNNGLVWIGDTNTKQVNIGAGGLTTPIALNGYIQSHVIPAIDSTYDLGENATPLRWRNIYADDIYGNLHPTASLIPAADNTDDLGSLALRWKTLYLGPASLKVYQDPNTTGSADEDHKITVGYDASGLPPVDGEFLFTDYDGGRTMYFRTSAPTSTPGASGNQIIVVTGTAATGDGIVAGGVGGAISLTAGDGGASGGAPGPGAGGAILLLGGTGGSGGNANGGNVNVYAGPASGTANGGNLDLRGGNGTTKGTIYLGQLDTAGLQIGSGGNTCPTTAYGDITPGTDNSFKIGSPGNRWARGHFGPSSLYVHNDNTDTDKLAILFSSGTQADIRFTMPAGGGTFSLNAVTPTTPATAGHAISVIGGTGAVGGTTGVGGNLTLNAGTGGASGVAKGGDGGIWTGAGGMGGAASATNAGRAGGATQLWGGQGGVGAAGLGSGIGGTVYVYGGPAGDIGGGPGGTGGDVVVDAGQGKGGPHGSIYLARTFTTKLYFGANAEPVVGPTPTAFGQSIGSTARPFSVMHAQTFRAWDNPGLVKSASYEYNRVLGDGTSPFDFGIGTHPIATTPGMYAYFFAGKGGAATGAGASGGIGGESWLVGGLGGDGVAADAPGNGGILRLYGGNGGVGGSGNSDGGDVHIRGGVKQGTGKAGSISIAQSDTYNCYLPDNGGTTVTNKVYIGGTLMNTNFTGANINILLADPASDASSLHTHTGLSSSSVDVPATAKEALVVGQPVLFFNDAGTAKARLSDANAAGRQDCVGLVALSAAGDGNPTKIRVAGEIGTTIGAGTYWDTDPAVGDVGKRVYISLTQGKLTYDVSGFTTTGDLILRIGWISSVDVGNTKAYVVLGIGEGVTV